MILYFFCFYRYLNVFEVVICLWEYFMGNVGEGIMERVEIMCFEGVGFWVGFC